MLCLVGVMTGCSVRLNGDPTPLFVDVVEDTTLRLLTECAEEVRADVAESAERVAIYSISGRVQPGLDCLGWTEISLSSPLGDRTLVVEGTPWSRGPMACSYDYVAPDTDLTGPC